MKSKWWSTKSDSELDNDVHTTLQMRKETDNSEIAIASAWLTIVRSINSSHVKRMAIAWKFIERLWKNLRNLMDP